MTAVPILFLTSSDVIKVMYMSRLLTYSECKSLCKDNNVRCGRDYYTLRSKLIERGDVVSMPYTPNRTYASDWVSWGDFLDKNAPSKVLLTYPECKSLCKANNVCSEVDYRMFRAKLIKRGACNIPCNPNHVYASDWVSWSDFLDKNAPSKMLLTYPECKSLCKDNNVRCGRDYYALRNKLIERDGASNIPCNPYRVYASDWVSWDDFLDKKYVLPEKVNNVVKTASVKPDVISKPYMSYTELKGICASKSISDIDALNYYIVCCGDGTIPRDVESTYTSDGTWVSFDDLFSCTSNVVKGDTTVQQVCKPVVKQSIPANNTPANNPHVKNTTPCVKVTDSGIVDTRIDLLIEQNAKLIDVVSKLVNLKFTKDEA